MIYIGTTALAHHGLMLRKSKDTDVMVPNDLNLTSNHELDVIPISNEAYSILQQYCDGEYASPNAIYTIKCSHLGWSNPQWQKHKNDVLVLKQKGCILIPELYDALVKSWKVSLGDKSFLNLDKSKDDFFTDNVEYDYDHDMLHELVTYPNPPIYKKCLMDGKEVLIDKRKFDRLDFSDKVSMFREEITVIALERWYLKDYWFNKGMTWSKSYQLSLQKTITSLTKGWATDFIVLNLEHFILPCYIDFVKVIRSLNLEEKYMSKYLGEDGRKLIQDILNTAYAEGIFEEHYSLQDYFEECVCEGESIPTECEFITKEGGGEGGTEDCFSVFIWKGKYYRADYNYFSYHGTTNYNMDEIYEVSPVVRPETYYEAKD